MPKKLVGFRYSTALQIGKNCYPCLRSVHAHIYASPDGQNFTDPGQTGAHDLHYFRFDANDTFSHHPAWRNGPQDGVTYWFRVFALRAEGGATRLDTGPVRFEPPQVNK